MSRYLKINKKLLTTLLHVLTWIVVFSLPTLLRPYNPSGGRMSRNPDENNFFYVSFLTNFLWIMLFYVNSSVLVRRYLFNGKYWYYLLANIAAYLAIIILHSFIFSNLIHSRPFNLKASLGFNLSAFLLTIAASIIYRSFIDNAERAKLAQQKQEEDLKTELYFLRSQISPHFIFNVLNNIVALARLKSEQLEPTVMKLSSLMQYMLYETDEERVSLQTEAEYLQSYIDLQKQRFGAKVNVNFDLELKDEYAGIEPMLLIPFVENAFKHGVGMIVDPEITIRLHADEKVLDFQVSNRYAPESDEVKDKTSGIGLPNVTRRLNLLYPKQHDLFITKDENRFSVSLKLHLRP